MTVRTIGLSLGEPTWTIAMTLDAILLDQLDESHLRSLKENEVSEGLRLEYKEDMPGNSRDEKKEFLRDVSALANTAGGDLIIEIREERGIPVDVCGVEVDDPDGAIRRLDDIMHHGLEPRIPGVRIQPVLLEDRRHVFVIRLPQSWAAPHRVAFQSTPQFYARRSNGKYPLDVHELRAAFLLSETVAERIRNFRVDRIAKILANEGPVPLEDGPKMLLHVVPLNAFRPGASCHLTTLHSDDISIGSVYWGEIKHYMRRYNLDGLAAIQDTEGAEKNSYAQYFRNGIIESVDLLPRRKENELHYGSFEHDLPKGLKRLLRLNEGTGVQPPLVIMLTITGVRGYTIPYGRDHSASGGPPHPINRNDLLIPEIIIEDFETDVDRALEPIIDAMWNASGWSQSMHRADPSRDVARLKPRRP